MAREKTAKEMWEERIGKEDRKPGRSADGGLGEPELRDRFLERYPAISSSPTDWMEYGKGLWQPLHENQVMEKVVDVLEGSMDEGVKPTSRLASSVRNLVKYRTFISAQRWDSTDVLVLENGTLEPNNGEFREHRQEDYATAKLPYEYDPRADCEVFEAVIETTVPECKNLLQEFAGYCLTKDTTLEAALWLKGPRGSGKSTVIEAITSMLGPRSGLLGLADIELSRFALGRIPGKTMLYSTEQPASYLRSTHVLDALISGEMLTVERKNVDPEEIIPTAKLMWAMNDLPRIGNTTSGIFRRVHIIDFPEPTTDRDPAIKRIVKEEAPGILNWALAGLKRLQERGGFDWPEVVKRATEEFQTSNDLPAQFVEEMCERGKEAATESRYLYEKYAEWCKEGGHQPASINRMSEDWKRLGFKKRRTKKGHVWDGVRYIGYSSPEFVT